MHRGFSGIVTLFWMLGGCAATPVYQQSEARQEQTPLRRLAIDAPVLSAVLGRTCDQVGSNCCAPDDGSQVSHCEGSGLGCNIATGSCEACGAPGQPCCDGHNTDFSGKSYQPFVGDTEMCQFTCDARLVSGGYDDVPAVWEGTRICGGECGTRAGEACCGADARYAMGRCSADARTGRSLTCQDPWAGASSTCVSCGQLWEASCGETDRAACEETHPYGGRLTDLEGTCVPCGGLYEPVCSSGTACELGFAASGGVCEPCGHAAELACDSIPRCELGLVARHDRCEAANARPYMGWNSWYTYWEGATEVDIRAQADAMVSSGLRELGYDVIGLDGGWWTKADNIEGTPYVPRGPSGEIIARPDRFPSGMKALGDYLHDRDLRYGLYTDTGASGCGASAGSGGFYESDTRTFAQWGADLLKVDNCGNKDAAIPEAIAFYSSFRDAMTAASAIRPMLMNICEWGWRSPWLWAPSIGTSWRTGNDITFEGAISWSNVLRNFDANAHAAAQSPGAYNDPDYLLIGGFGLSQEEERSYFSMWAIAGAPLMLATDLTRLTPETMAIVGNPEVIEVDQDLAGNQGVLVRQDFLMRTQVWRKIQLPDAYGRSVSAVLLLNRSEIPMSVETNWGELGFSRVDEVRDLWARTELAVDPAGYSTTVPPHGVVMLKLTGVE